jgi:hypothetical protein
MNTLDQFAAFLYRAQDEAFEETRDKIPTTYTEYTKKGDASKADARSVTGIKLGPLAFTAQGGGPHFDEYAPGTERVTKYKKFSLVVVTPEELISDMMTGNRVEKDKVRLFLDIPKDFANSANWSYEILSLQFQQLGTATTVTNTFNGTGRDGLALFTTAHVTTKGTPITWSNRQTVTAMNQISLMEGVTMLEATPSEVGQPLGSVKRVGVVHGRYWEWRVPELITSVKQPDTFNNQQNAMKLRGVEWVPILNPYLAATDATWMLLDLDNHELLFFMKQKATYSRGVNDFNGNQINRCVTRVATDFWSAKMALINA